MSHEPGQDDGPVTGPAWSYKPPGQREDIVTIGGQGWTERSRRIAIGSAVAVVAMLGGAAVAFAATNATASPSASAVGASSSPSPKPAPQFGRPFHRFGVGPGGTFGFGFPGGVFGPVHGQVVVVKPGGSYQTVDFQRGKVTAVSTSSITVRSSDGFTASYSVAASTMVDAQRDGIGSVKVGNQVSVLAMVSGSKATATSITDITLFQQGQPPSMSYGSSSNLG
jgi:hypothetical protein